MPTLLIATYTRSMPADSNNLQKNFTAVVLAIVVVSVLPIVLEVIAARREASSEQGGKGNEGGSRPT